MFTYTHAPLEYLVQDLPIQSWMSISNKQQYRQCTYTRDSWVVLKCFMFLVQILFIEIFIKKKDDD
jgi:hypothetical protein